METKSQTRVAIRYGAILGLINVIIYLMFYFGGASVESRYPTYIGYVVDIIVIVFGVKAYRDQYCEGFITYGKSLGTGVLIGLFSGIISAIFTVLMFTVIDPGLGQKIIEATQQKLADRGMTEEQIQMSITMTKKFMHPALMFIFAIAGTVLITFIFSLVISIFMKKEKPFEGGRTDVV